MTVPVITRVGVAVALGAALIVFDAMWDDIFFPDFAYFKATENGVMHLMRKASLLEVIVRIAILLLALAGAAGYVARITKKRQLLAGALTSTCVALIALLAIHNIDSPDFGPGYIPHPINLAVWGVVSFAVGAVASAAAVRRPNPSLERTRER